MLFSTNLSIPLVLETDTAPPRLTAFLCGCVINARKCLNYDVLVYFSTTFPRVRFTFDPEAWHNHCSGALVVSQARTSPCVCRRRRRRSVLGYVRVYVSTSDLPGRLSFGQRPERLQSAMVSVPFFSVTED